jgi:hypothetical protein
MLQMDVFSPLGFKPYGAVVVMCSLTDDGTGGWGRRGWKNFRYINQ